MLKNISFRQIEIFLTAAKYENFSKAAEELFMTQASVSRNIAAMEETLGIVLFVRHRQRVCLTEAGRSLSKDLRLLVKKADSAYARALEKQENLSQRLKVGDVNYTDADQYLMPIAKKLEARYPEAQLILERSEADVLVEFLETDRYDAIFLINDLLPTVTASDICRERVCTVDPCIVLADTHPLFSKEEITLEDLRKEQMVASRSGCFRFYWDFVCAVSKEFGLNRSDVKFEDNFLRFVWNCSGENGSVWQIRCSAPC